MVMRNFLDERAVDQRSRKNDKDVIYESMNL